MDAAGRRYNVALRYCPPALRSALAGVLSSLTGMDGRVARRGVSHAPRVVMAAEPFSRAEEAACRLRGLAPLGTVVVEVTPWVPPPVPGPVPRRFTSPDQALAYVRWEAARLGVTVGDFVHPKNCGNRILLRAIRVCAPHARARRAAGGAS